MPFKKGDAKPAKSGRKRGQANKNTTELKDAILKAFEQAGGTRYLKDIAATNPQVFCSLLGRVLPMTVGGDPEQPHKLIIEWQESSESG